MKRFHNERRRRMFTNHEKKYAHYQKIAHANKASNGASIFKRLYDYDIPDNAHIKKYQDLFLKLDFDKIIDMITTFYLAQIRTIETVCVSREVKMDRLRAIHLYIIDEIGKDNIKMILEEYTEEYSMWRTGAISVYIFLVLYGLLTRNKIITYITISSYSIYIYSKMFYKYIEFCNPEIMNASINQSHKLSLIGTEYKKGGHIKVIEAIVVNEIIKLLKIVATFQKKIPVVPFSRIFSSVKNRLNQATKNFANSSYYPVYKKYKKDKFSTDEIDSSGMTMMINNIINSYKSISYIPEQYIEYISRSAGLSDSEGSMIINKFTDSRNDVDTNSDFSKFIINIFRAGKVTNKSDICNNVFYKDYSNMIKSKSPAMAPIKQPLESLIKRLFKVDNQVKFLRIRNFLGILIYHVYIKPATC